jgi:astacin (peptidase family M12A)
MTLPSFGALRCAIVVLLVAFRTALAGLYVNTISPGNVPWPGGTVPYVFDPALSAAQQQTYLNAVREYELAANVHFVPRTSETQYILFKYDPAGFDQVSGSNPQTISVSSLTRAQICHEMGHSFGLLHEHTRSDQSTYVNVLTANIATGNQHWFNVDPNGTSQGSYDFESVMHFPRDLFSTQPGVLDTLQAKTGYEKFQPRMGGFALSKGDRAVMKFLFGAGPVLSSVVTNTSESGVGGLRAALHYATDHPSTTITFNIPTTDSGYANGVFTIHFTGHLLPLVADGTIIDGTTQPGYGGNPLIVLDGSQILSEAGAVPATVPGMTIYAANSTVRGLSIQRFPWVGIAFLYADAHNNTVRGCRLGLDYTGTAAAPNQYQGIYIFNGANSNTIGGATSADRNILSGNNQYGVWISGPTTTGNVVSGNYIGTRADGLGALPNALGGIIITDGSTNNTIGGTSPGAQNVISGNASAGVWIKGAGVNQNTVRGNYIGLGATGSAVPNTFAGIRIESGAANNVVANNVISGNTSEGLRIIDAGSSGNIVQGNLVGTAPGGTSAVPNGFAGVTMYNGATGNIIGGTAPSARNILSGNGTVGLAFGDSGTSGNTAQGNYIGTDITGTAAVPNGFAGVYLTNGASANQLGGVQGGARNIISGNAGYGVFVADPGTNGNSILGNFIGTNAIGTAPLSNAYAGIDVLNGAHDNTIGGSAVGASNLISGNTNEGIVLYDSTTIRNSIRQNSIFANGAKGIVLNNNSNNSQLAPTSLSGSVSTAANPNGTDVSGSFASGASTLEFFASPTADPSGFGEGQFFIGSLSVPGAGPFTAHLPAIVPAGYVIAATATSNGNTSEFSQTFTVPAYTDNGSDGTPDQWMLAHFGHVDPQAGDKSRATDDADGDGFTNLQELKAGTDPRDPNSRFAISIDRSASNPRINLTSVAGKTYRLEYRDDLIAGSWSTLVDQIFGTGAAIQIIDPSAAGVSKRFYRAVVVP